MWWPYLLICLLFLSTVHSYKSGFYATGGRYGKRTLLPINRRESRSGIFWTGSRYNRRGSDTSGIKVIRKGSENFFMGSRYGKRTDGEVKKPTFEMAALCKFNSYHPICSNR